MEEQVTFTSGDVTLEGLLSLPMPAPSVGVVVCHPHPLRGGDMHNNVVAALLQALQAAGHATLRFNFRGVGASTGSHDDGNGEQDDVKAAVTHLLSRHAVTTVCVAGYSFGALVGLKAAAADPRVAKLIGVALPIATRDASFLQAVTKPKLLVSGDRDDFSPLDGLHRLLASAEPPKKLHVVPGADHFFWGRESEVGAAATTYLAT